jgi:hypothetical protein
VACRIFLDCQDNVPLESAAISGFSRFPVRPTGFSCQPPFLPPALQKLPAGESTARCFARQVVTSSMHAPRGPRQQTGPARTPAGFSGFPGVRYATCFSAVFLEKDSHSCRNRVHWANRWAETDTSGRKRPADPTRQAAVRRDSDWHAGRIHSAARNGNRKRTRVRVACGGGIRPRGLGHQPIHGHLGLPVVDRETLPHVVLEPARDPVPKGISGPRHFSRGPGLLAALIRVTPDCARLSAHLQSDCPGDAPERLLLDPCRLSPPAPSGTSGGR